MVKHIVLFTFQEGVDKEEGTRIAAQSLEPLVGKIPGLISLEVRRAYTGPDFVLLSVHEDAQALQSYAVHPLHLEAKDHFFHLLAGRTAADYEL